MSTRSAPVADRPGLQKCNFPVSILLGYGIHSAGMTSPFAPNRSLWHFVPRGAGSLLVTAFLIAPAHAQTLSDAVERAWSLHPTASATSARAAEAQARADVAAGITPGPPSLSLSSLNDRLNNNRGKQEWELEMAVPLWLPGQKAARESEADSAVADVVARRAALRLQIAGEVREAWWVIAAARNSHDLARRRVATAAKLESDVMRRFKAGELARIDANVAQNERLLAENEELSAGVALRQANEVYRALTNADAPASLAEEMPAPPRDIAENHTELAAAAASARLAQARLKVAEETLREAPALAVRMVRDRAEFSEPYANMVGIKLTVPFSSGPRVRQENSAARAEAAQADAELALAQRRIQLESARARLEVDVAEQQLSKARERRDLTADNLRLAEKSFALGESDLTALQRARASAYEAEALLGRQAVARAASISRLNQSLGVLP